MKNQNKKAAPGSPQGIADALGVTVQDLMDLIMHLVLVVDAAGTLPAAERLELFNDLQPWQTQFLEVFPFLVPQKMGGMGQGEIIEVRWVETLKDARTRFDFNHIAGIHRKIAIRQGAAK